jgi:hypothetical protein
MSLKKKMKYDEKKNTIKSKNMCEKKEEEKKFQ